ncbi:MAG: CPBP family intramembrane glutamic endopeptidase, partial [Planctomycetota bacterium]
MQILGERIRKRPIRAFYIICYAISWSLWLPLILSGSQIAELFAAIGVYGGPGIACIIVARISPPSTRLGRSAHFRLAFLIAWIVCTIIFFAYQRVSSPEKAPLAAIIVFAIFALVPAYIIASAFSRSSGVRRTLSSLVRPRGGWYWYLVALLLPLAIALISVWVSKLLGWRLLSEPERPSSLLQLAASILIIFLYTFIYAGGLNEETGWTGFAIPRFLARYNPLVATIIVWGLWMLWHVPMHFSGYFNLSLHVLVGSFFGRFLMTWLFIRTKGGILSAMLLHVSVNVTSQFIPITNASLLVGAIIATLLIFAARMWHKLPQASP